MFFLAVFPAPPPLFFPIRQRLRWGLRFLALKLIIPPQGLLLGQLFQLLLKTEHAFFLGGFGQKGALLQRPHLFGLVHYLCLQLRVSTLSHLQVFLKDLQRYLGLLQLKLARGVIPLERPSAATSDIHPRAPLQRSYIAGHCWLLLIASALFVRRRLPYWVRENFPWRP